MQASTALPNVFVWTKFGIEAGQTVPAILKRKERERRMNDGVFLWGVGNNVGSSIRLLVNSGFPEVLFSPIVSAPRECDVSPNEVVAWTEAEALDGTPFNIPRGSLVTSRGGARKKCHFALVCYSKTELLVTNSNGSLCSAALRNLASGRQVGSSQVTSVVETRAQLECGRAYQVAMRLELTPPYFVKLTHPVAIKSDNLPNLELSYNRPIARRRGRLVRA
jgi:hypothetical protein